jgi:hypothetical protein
VKPPALFENSKSQNRAKSSLLNRRTGFRHSPAAFDQGLTRLDATVFRRGVLCLEMRG